MKVVRVVIDGNDGVGKDTIAALLRLRDVLDQYRPAVIGGPKTILRSDAPAQDTIVRYIVRDLPTILTDHLGDIPFTTGEPDTLYLILDAPVEVCRERLAKADKNLNERYHNVADLTYYRERFIRVCGSLHNAVLIDATHSIDEIVQYIEGLIIERFAPHHHPEQSPGSG